MINRAAALAEPTKTTVAAGRVIHDYEQQARHAIASLPEDDGSPILYRWHFPRGTFEKRMSALEIFGFLVKHMDSVAGMLSDRPRIHHQFMVMRNRFLTATMGQLDEVRAWVKSVVKREADDIVELCLGGVEHEPTPLWFVMGSKALNTQWKVISQCP